MKSLHEYFNTVRNRPGSVSEEQLQDFVLKHTENRGDLKAGQSVFKRLTPNVLTLSAIGLGLAACVWFLVGESLNPPHETNTETAANHHRAMVIEGCGCPVEEFVGLPHGKASDIAPAALSMLPMLELPDVELKQIGIEKHSDGITLYRQRPGSASHSVERDMFRSANNDHFHMFGTPPHGVTPLPLYPRLVTDDLGRMRRFYYSYAEIDPKLEDSINMVRQRYNYLSDAGRIREALDSMNNYPRYNEWFRELHGRSRQLIDFNTLVPVYVRSTQSSDAGESLQQRCRPDVIVWFDATPELLQLLPHDWQDRMESAKDNNPEFSSPVLRTQKKGEQIIKEAETPGTEVVEQKADIGAIESVTSSQSKKAKESTRDGMRRNTTVGPGPGEPSIRINPGAIGRVSLLPNPVDRAGSLMLQLRENRTVGISLHSIEGTRLGMLIGDQFLKTGQHSIALSFEDVPPGIYLLAVSTDYDELQVHRIIVR